jgi:lipoyl(octanoyl) transferase
MRWHLLNSGPTASANNMAWDEALLEAAPRFGQPVLRFYAWTEPAATFGYFQKFAEVERLTKLRPLIRRPTGGGLVPHDADWTYSLAFPAGDPWHALKAVESYRRVHEWIQAAFAGASLATELAPCCRQKVPGQCFIGAEQFDLLWQGQKIAGAAQRRTRDGLLIQGSIQPPAGASRNDFEKAFCEAARAQWGVEWRALEADAALRARVLELVREKYSQWDYNERR